MTTTAATRDLARSGLTQADAKIMHVVEMGEKSVRRLTKRFEVPAYRLPYFDAQGREIDYFRLRFFEPVEDIKSGKQIRYWQPPRTAPEVYFPPQVDWSGVLNSKQDVIVTEGEKKAAAGCKLLKVPTLGLGGIWSWGSKRTGTPLLPALVPFMKDRRVLFCFDSDADPNPDVVAARGALAHAASRYGADPWVVRLPAGPPGVKIGLDDFLVLRGAEAFQELEPTRYGDQAIFEKLNRELAFIERPHAYYHLATQALFADPKRYAQGAYSDQTVVVYDTQGNPKERNAVLEWTKWTRRTRYTDLVYEPGQGRVTRGALNIWPGWGVPPHRGSVSLFLELVDHLFRDSKKEHRDWLLRWLAYPLQHPGTKLYTSVLFMSLEQGVGKSLLGLSMKQIYGMNFVNIKAKHLHGDFNEWMRYKQFVLGDEVTGKDRQEDIDHLNNIITQEVVRVNEKFQAAYEVQDRANYCLTTNRPTALMLAREDRRFFVHEVIGALPPEFYDEYDAWYKSETGAAALFDYLLKLELGNFNPRARAPLTDAKLEMVNLASTPAEFDLRALLLAPNRWLLGSVRDLYQAHELARFLDPTGRLHAVSLGRALKTLGIRRHATKTAEGVIGLYAVRNTDRWNRASHAERAAHYESGRGVVA